MNAVDKDGNDIIYKSTRFGENYSERILITIPGKPKALQRARKGENGFYDPSRDVKINMRAEALIQKALPRLPLLKEFAVIVRAYFKNDRFINMDIDNILKLVQDAYNGYIWKDDRFITKAIVEKFQCNKYDEKDKERTDIVIYYRDLPIEKLKKIEKEEKAKMIRSK